MKEDPNLRLQIALVTQETQRLEDAYRRLYKQFEQMRAKLSSSRQTLEQIITHMSDGLLFITLKGLITLYNPAAADITGVASEDVLGNPFWNHFSDSLFGFPLAHALKKGQFPGRLVLSLSNGREIEVAPTYIPEKGLLLLLNDRTELKQLEKSVQHSDRLKELGEMAATLAHEIRNPLGGIEGFASLLKRELATSSQQRMVDAILTGSRTLNTLVANVLEYARPLMLHFIPTDLAVFIEETVELAKASGYVCDMILEKEQSISIDAKRVQLVLLNLIRNAQEAGSTKTEIVLTQAGTIQVKDQGEGIPPDRMEKVFFPFFTTKSTGTGLGLSEVYKVMCAHGGSITIDSKVGKGTCITLDFLTDTQTKSHGY